MTQTYIVSEINRISHALATTYPMDTDTGSFYAPYMPMFKKTKYQFSRVNWYVAHYAKLAGRLGVDTEVFQWCTDNFGPMVQHPDAWSRWAPGAAWSTIRFRDERDYIWFTLRWGK